jgi:hypothetical protein
MLPAGLFSTTATYTGPAQEIISSAHSGDAAALLQALTREDDDDDDPDTRLSALGSSYQQDPSSTTAALAQALQLANRDAGDVEAIARVTADALIRGGIEGKSPIGACTMSIAVKLTTTRCLLSPCTLGRLQGAQIGTCCSSTTPAGDATKAFSAAYVAARASNSSSLVNIVHSLLPGARAVFSLP